MQIGAPHNRKNWWFAGSEPAGKRAAAIMSLLATVMTQCFLLRCNLILGHPMSVVMEEEIKRCTARRKSALIQEIIQGNVSFPVK